MKNTKIVLMSLAISAAMAASASAQTPVEAKVRGFLSSDCASASEARDAQRFLAANRKAAVPLLLDAVKGDLTVLEKNEIKRGAVLEFDRAKAADAKPDMKAAAVALGDDPAAFAAKRLKQVEAGYKQRAVNAVLDYGEAQDVDALKSLAAQPATDAGLKKSITDGIKRRGL